MKYNKSILVTCLGILIIIGNVNSSTWFTSEDNNNDSYISIGKFKPPQLLKGSLMYYDINERSKYKYVNTWRNDVVYSMFKTYLNIDQIKHPLNVDFTPINGNFRLAFYMSDSYIADITKTSCRVELTHGNNEKYLLSYDNLKPFIKFYSIDKSNYKILYSNAYMTSNIFVLDIEPMMKYVGLNNVRSLKMITDKGSYSLGLSN